jgi:hypothetical protein
MTQAERRELAQQRKRRRKLEMELKRQAKGLAGTALLLVPKGPPQRFTAHIEPLKRGTPTHRQGYQLR